MHFLNSFELENTHLVGVTEFVSFIPFASSIILHFCEFHLNSENTLSFTGINDPVYESIVYNLVNI